MKIRPKQPINFNEIYRKGYNAGKYHKKIRIKYLDTESIYYWNVMFKREGKTKIIERLKEISNRCDFLEFV